jgi:hypothetical protein
MPNEEELSPKHSFPLFIDKNRSTGSVGGFWQTDTPRDLEYHLLNGAPVGIKKSPSLMNSCAPGEGRTPNRLIRSQVLYPLSYRCSRVEIIIYVMEIGRRFLESIQKLVKDRAVKKIHLSKRAEQEVRNYMTILYGRSFRKESEKIDDPLERLLGYPVQIHIVFKILKYTQISNS